LKTISSKQILISKFRYPNKLTTVILASSSPRRRAIFKRLKIPFGVVEHRISEKLKIRDPVRYVKTMARLKAEAVSRSAKGLIVSVDTVVVFDNRILGKPRDRREARAMLNLLSGRVHRVLSAITVIDTNRKCRKEAMEETKVKFRRLTQPEIENYINSPEPYDKAGGYGIQGRAGLFVEWINGCYWNVVGLPVARLLKLLEVSCLNLNSH